MDKVMDSGSIDAGSIPARDTMLEVRCERLEVRLINTLKNGIV